LSSLGFPLEQDPAIDEIMINMRKPNLVIAIYY
jgi:hypothetical protein